MSLILSQDHKDLWSAFCLFALGFFLLTLSIRFPFWSKSGPEAGFYPFLVALVMMGFSGLLAAKALLVLRRRKGRVPTVKHPLPNVGTTLRFLAYAFLLLTYGLVFTSLGFLVSSTLFLVFSLRSVEKQSWKTVISVAFLLVLLSYLLFSHFLGVPLPRGILSW